MNQKTQFRFENRREAGELLADKLKPMVLDERDLLVLGLPRGGVPVAYEVATALDLPLDILVVRKLGIPGREETAMGAIASGGFQTLDHDLIKGAGISEQAVEKTIAREQEELRRRELTYRGGRPPLSVAGRTVILVDDGIATGSTVLVALKFLREQEVAKVIVAAPVAASSTFDHLLREADDVVCVLVPEQFYAVGLWYEDFLATKDEEVCHLLGIRPSVMKKNSGKSPGKSLDCAGEDAGVIRDYAQPLLGASADYDPVLEMIGDASVVLLGEASHGTHEFYQRRAEITKRLVEQKEFDAVLIEGDFPDTLQINQYVCGRSDDKDSIEALAGFKRFPAWMWRNADVLDFVGWLRDHNGHIPADAEQVGVFGMDLYSMHKSMDEVVAYLEKIDPPAAKRARYRYLCLERFGSDPQNYGLLVSSGKTHGCEDEVLEQIKELRAREAMYLKDDGVIAQDDHFFAEQNARSVKSAEKYYRAMFHSGPESWNLRDDHMMETLVAIRKHLVEQRGKAKVVVWAHNSHLGDARVTSMGQRGERNLGQLVREKYGSEARLIGMTTYNGTVTAAIGWHLPPQRRIVRPGCEGSYEQLFHQVGMPGFFLRFDDGNPAARILEKPLLERAIGVVYRPETERQSHYFTTRISKQFDAILHFDETRAVEPLEKTNEWVKGELPESYPTGI